MFDGKKADELFDRLAVAGDSIGGAALRCAVLMCAENVEYEYMATKLYAYTAMQIGRSVSTVEREIRNTIKSCWEKCDRELMKNILPAYSGHEEKAPPNSLFIAAAAEWLRLGYYCSTN